MPWPFGKTKKENARKEEEMKRLEQDKLVEEWRKQQDAFKASQAAKGLVESYYNNVPRGPYGDVAVIQNWVTPEIEEQRKKERLKKSLLNIERELTRATQNREKIEENCRLTIAKAVEHEKLYKERLSEINKSLVGGKRSFTKKSRKNKKKRKTRRV